MANRYLIADGSWHNTSIWSDTSGGVGGFSVPTSNDYVYIDSEHIVCLTSNADCDGLTHTNGEIFLNGNNLTCHDTNSGGFVSSGNYARSIVAEYGTLVVILGNSENSNLSISGTEYGSLSDVNLIINIKEYNRNFNTAGCSFAHVTINLGDPNINDYNAVLNITGAASFSTLNIVSNSNMGHIVRFNSETGIKVRKLIAIGFSVDNKLRLNGELADGSPMNIDFSNDTYDGTLTSYGKNVILDCISAISSTNFNKYIGSTSNGINGSSGWTYEDVPKVSTLIDPLTVNPEDNPNWTISGSSPIKVTVGLSNGGYLSGEEQSVALESNHYYDFTDCVLFLESIINTGSIFGFKIGDLNILSYFYEFKRFNKIYINNNILYIDTSDDGQSWDNIYSSESDYNYPIYEDEFLSNTFHIELYNGSIIGSVNLQPHISSPLPTFFRQ